jgi:ABC-type polysaccharide/polyol phosphate export permease
MTETFDAVCGLVKRDWLTYSSYRAQLFSTMVGMVVSLTLYHFISQLVRVSTFGSPDAYFAFVVIGMVILQILQSTLGVAQTLRGELLAGTFERLVLSPFGAVRAMMSMMVFPFVMALVTSTVLLALATFVFGVDVRWDTAALALPLAVFGTGIFTTFGMLLTAVTLVFKRATGGIGFVLTLVSLSSGLFFPIALLPSWVQWFSKIQPFTATVDLLRHVLVATPLTDSVTLELAKLGGFLVTMIPLSILALRAGLRYAQRKGTIVEY